MNRCKDSTGNYLLGDNTTRNNGLYKKSMQFSSVSEEAAGCET